MVELDDATVQDTFALFELFKTWDDETEFDFRVFSESLRRCLSRADNRVIVARDRTKIVGYAHLFRLDEPGFPPAVEISQFLVAPDCRSRGIGKEIISRIEETARAMGITCVQLSSQTFRSRSHAFYEHAGFVKFKESRFYRKTL